MGACTQINKSSVIGGFGVKAGETAMKLLQNDMATIIASDAHDVRYRSPYMTEAFEYVKNVFSDEYAQVLFCENPSRIIADKGVLSNGPVPV